MASEARFDCIVGDKGALAAVRIGRIKDDLIASLLSMERFNELTWLSWMYCTSTDRWSSSLDSPIFPTRVDHS